MFHFMFLSNFNKIEWQLESKSKQIKFVHWNTVWIETCLNFIRRCSCDILNICLVFKSRWIIVDVESLTFTTILEYDERFNWFKLKIIEFFHYCNDFKNAIDRTDNPLNSRIRISNHYNRMNIFVNEKRNIFSSS